MHSLYSFALLALPMLATVLCEDNASPTQDSISNRPYSNPNDAFQDLLNALPEESLHVALNSLTTYKDGVFESDRHGVEHVHHDNPPLATRLIVAAVQDLKNRQAPASTNGTEATSAAPQTSQQASQTPSSQAPSSQAPSSQAASSQAASSQAPSQASSADTPTSSKDTEPAVVVPVPVTVTDSGGKTTVVSSAILSKATAFVPVQVTRTNAQGSTVVSQETKPAVIFTATNPAGSAFVTTSAVNYAPSSREVLTTTDAEGSTFLTTYTPGGGRVSSIVLLTTKGADGQPSVITSYTYVDPAAATATDNPEATTTAVKPGLQTGAARKNIVLEMAVVGGAVGGAFVLFV